MKTFSPTTTYSHTLSKNGLPETIYVWEVNRIDPFNELIVSWNATRPRLGEYQLGIAVKTNHTWSLKCLYSIWGSDCQMGGNADDIDIPFTINQDILQLKPGNAADGFRVYLEAKNGAHLKDFETIFACASIMSNNFREILTFPGKSIELVVPLISQMKLSHPRHMDMCSAASTVAVVNYFLGLKSIEPVSFALQAHDHAFDIFGNWVLNTAQASVVLGDEWNCRVQRLTGFDDIFGQLQKNQPVVVSLKGPLSGGAFPYNQGHLVVVKGYDHIKRKVLCMDPAFPENESTDVGYDLQDFMAAWSRRGCIAYLFERKKEGLDISA